MISENTDDLLKYMGVDRLTARMQPMVAIPTTAGTGSEVTNVAVIRNEGAGAKMAFMSNKLYPHVAILDPAMTMTMPPRITAATGMDALTHAVEAIYGLQKNPVSDAFGAAAIRLIRDFLLKAVENGDDEEARLAMANAALLAGMSFSNSMVGMVHGLGHACGAVGHIPHGVAMGVLLPFVMEYNMDRNAPLYAELLLPLAGIEEYAGTREGDRARRCVDRVRALRNEIHRAGRFPLGLGEAGVKREDLEKIAKTSLLDGAMIVNPVEVDFEDALDVLRKAY